MKPVFKKILRIGWRLILCLGAVAFIYVAVSICIAYMGYLNGYRYKKDLSESVCVRIFCHRNEIRVYNYTTDSYTLKGLQWVADAPAKDSLTVFCRAGKRGFLNVNTGEPVIGEQYDKAWIFSEGVAAVVRNGKIGFINSKNEIVLPFEYDYSNRNGWPIDYLFRSGYCTMTNAYGACGLIDKTGKWVVDAKYDCIWPPHDGKYRIVKDGDKYGLLDENLEFIFPVEYDNINYSYERGLFLCKDGYKWQVDYDGTVLKPFVCDNMEHISYPSNSESYMLNNNYGDESKVAELSYTFSEEYMSYEIGGKYGIVRKDNGKVVIPALYSEIDMVSPTLFKAKIDDSYGSWIFIDVHGRIIDNKQ